MQRTRDKFQQNAAETNFSKLFILGHFLWFPDGGVFFRRWRHRPRATVPTLRERRNAHRGLDEVGTVATVAGRWFFWAVAPYFFATLQKNAYYEGPEYGKSMVPPSEIDKSMAAILRRFSEKKSLSDGGTILLPYSGPS